MTRSKWRFLSRWMWKGKVSKRVKRGTEMHNEIAFARETCAEFEFAFRSQCDESYCRWHESLVSPPASNTRSREFIKHRKHAYDAFAFRIQTSPTRFCIRASYLETSTYLRMLRRMLLFSVFQSLRHDTNLTKSKRAHFFVGHWEKKKPKVRNLYFSQFTCKHDNKQLSWRLMHRTSVWLRRFLKYKEASNEGNQVATINYKNFECITQTITKTCDDWM